MVRSLAPPEQSLRNTKVYPKLSDAKDDVNQSNYYVNKINNGSVGFDGQDIPILEQTGAPPLLVEPHMIQWTHKMLNNHVHCLVV